IKRAACWLANAQSCFGRRRRSTRTATRPAIISKTHGSAGTKTPGLQAMGMTRIHATIGMTTYGTPSFTYCVARVVPGRRACSSANARGLNAEYVAYGTLARYRPCHRYPRALPRCDAAPASNRQNTIGMPQLGDDPFWTAPSAPTLGSSRDSDP